MRPTRIILVRHGETEANLDQSLYSVKPDHAMELTDLGRTQARVVGEQVCALLNGDRVRVYVSPYRRAHQTLDELGLGARVDEVHEEPRLREQDWGNLQDLSRTDRVRTERDAFGHFYYRFENGESGADVYDRVSTFLETMHRDFDHPDYPPAALVVTHGLTMRLFCMRWFHWTVDYFESLENPGNCELRQLVLVGDNYVLDQPFRQWRIRQAH